MPAVATATAITSHTLIRDPDIQSPFRVVAFVPVSRGSVLKPTAAHVGPGPRGKGHFMTLNRSGVQRNTREM
jgi:hypothetical protein